MSWLALVAIMRRELGAEKSRKIERIIIDKLGGVRLTIGKRQPLSYNDIDSVAPGKPAEAARKLNVHPSTVYRVLRKRIIR